MSQSFLTESEQNAFAEQNRLARFINQGGDWECRHCGSTALMATALRHGEKCPLWEDYAALLVKIGDGLDKSVKQKAND